MKTKITSTNKNKRLILLFSSLFLWLISLPLISFSTYNGPILKGYEVFAIGWLGPINGIFAWFANPFYIYSAINIVRNKRAFKASLASSILALSTFSFSSYLADEAGGHHIIYGYGWGAIFWVLANILLIPTAATLETSEFRSKTIKYPSYLFILLFLTFVISMSFYDHLVANQSESNKLEKLSFKKGPVCQIDNYTLIQKIKDISVPIGVNTYPALGYFDPIFNDPEELLRWGVKSVVLNNEIYSTTTLNDETIIWSHHESTYPSTIISIFNNTDEYGRTSKTIRLDDNGTILFNHSWSHNGVAYCPEYNELYPKPDEQPRSILQQALNIENQTKLETLTNRYYDHRITTNPITISKSSASEMFNLNFDEIKENTDNINCPSNIGFVFRDEIKENNFKRGFKFKDAFFYPKNIPNAFRSTCTKDNIYIYSTEYSNNTYYLMIEERKRSDFSKTWTRVIDIPANHMKLKSSYEFKILSVSKSDSNRIIIINNQDNDKIITLDVLNEKIMHS